jgi:hypothetical protein
MTRATNRRPWGAAAAALALSAVGCVERTLTIRTVPDGATVILNDQEVGTSPVSVPFTWYGDYDLICRKAGYATREEKLCVSAPWYQLPGIDIVTECFSPVTYRDHRAFEITLEPERLPTRDELLSRGAEFRDRALYQGAD